MTAAADRPGMAGLRTARVETLADGVFAIAMTLLVLDIRVPLPHDPAHLPERLLDLGPNLFSYALSFVVLGVYWVGHHNQYRFIQRADRAFLWINILFLLSIAFIPFSAGLLAEYPAERLAVAVYGGNLVVVGLVLYLHWWYATSHRLADDVPPEAARSAARRILLAPFLYVVAVGLSLWTTRASLTLYVLVPLLYILPARIDRHLVGRGSGPGPAKPDGKR